MVCEDAALHTGSKRNVTNTYTDAKARTKLMKSSCIMSMIRIQVHVYFAKYNYHGILKGHSTSASMGVMKQPTQLSLEEA